MAAPPNTAEASPPPGAGEDANDGVEVCLFDESADGFSRTVRAISELTTGEPELDFPEDEVDRIASSITFLREWRHFSYEPKVVSFTNDTESASSRNDTHNITLPQFSSASVPQVMRQEDQKDNAVSFDFVLFAGGNVWALDWCPRLSDNKPGSSINCEHLAVSAHPPGSSYHKLGMPLTGRGIIQVWCLLAPFEDGNSCQSLDACGKSGRRGRPRKIPDEKNSVGTSSNPPKPRGRPRKIPDGNNPVGSSSNPPKPRGRPRKIPDGNNSVSSPSKPPKPRGRPRKRPIDLSEPVPKRPRGRPRKHPLPVAIVEDSSLNSGTQDIVLYDPLSASTIIPDDLPLASFMPSAKSTPGKGRGRPRKNPTDKVTGSSGTTLTEDVCIALSPTTATCTKPKRRGRPQKYPVPSNISSISSTEIESGKIITCQAKDHSACTEFDANPSTIAADAALPITSSTATCDNMSQVESGRRQNEEELVSNSFSCSVVPCVESCSKRETVSNDPMVFVENALSSGQSNIVSVTSEVCSVNMLSCEGNVDNGVQLDNSVLPNHISSSKRGGGRHRKNPVSAATSFSGVSGGNSPKTASVQSDSDKHTALDQSADKVIVSNLDSITSRGFDIEKCSVHLNDVVADVASPAHGLHSAERKEESITKRGRCGSRRKHVSTECGIYTDLNNAEPRTLITPKSNSHVALIGSCVEGSHPGMGSEQHKELSASNENNFTSIGGDAHAMVMSSKSTAMHTSRSDNMANEACLSGYKNEIVGCKFMKVNENDTGNDISHCNTENAQANEVAPINNNNGIDGVKAAGLVPIEESREYVNKSSSIEHSNSFSIPKDIALPRVVLCLAHNGKVAWDVKWKPLVPNQSEQESCLGFLAVLLGNGSLEVWEVPSPRMIQKIYSPSMVVGSDPRFLKLQPVFKCAKVTCGNRQSIPLTVDWSPSPPHDMILAGCHDGTVALWKFSTNFSSQDSKPFMCVTADSVPIRDLSWAPSDENINTFVTAGEDGLKFWDLRDPYRPLWELTTAPRAVLSLHWLKDARGIIISLEDGTLKFLSLSRIANDVPVTGRPFVGTKTQGVSTYQLSEYLIWSVHASESTGYAVYCGADGTAVCFQLTSRFWEKEPGRNRAPYFLCGSLSEGGGNIKICSNSQKSPLLNVPLGAKKGPKPCQDVVQVQDVEKVKLQNNTDSGDFLALPASCENPELGDGHVEEQGAGAIVLAGPTERENDGLWNSKAGESPKDFEIFPPKSVALHRVRWNTNKGSERWLCYGGAAGIIRCQRI